MKQYEVRWLHAKNRIDGGLSSSYGRFNSCYCGFNACCWPWQLYDVAIHPCESAVLTFFPTFKASVTTGALSAAKHATIWKLPALPGLTATCATSITYVSWGWLIRIDSAALLLGPDPVWPSFKAVHSPFVHPSHGITCGSCSTFWTATTKTKILARPNSLCSRSGRTRLAVLLILSLLVVRSAPKITGTNSHGGRKAVCCLSGA